MSSTATGPAAPEVTEVKTDAASVGEEPSRTERGRLRRSLPVVVMLGVVGVLAALPMIRNHIYYFWDDTAVAGVPDFRRMAEVVLSGNFPLLELDMWRGGNFAAEAAVGMWNPVALGLAIITHPIDNMALAMSVIKITFMGIMAAGSYLLAREYKVRPWLAATMGTVAPLCGYTFFMDATAWVNALMVTSFIPWVWWTARRAITKQGSMIWVIVAGYLCCSLGPYALLATGVILFGVMLEAYLTGQRKRIVPVLLSGVAVGLLNLMIYLPLLGTQGVGYRAGSGTFNNEFLRPSITDLFGLSTPAFQPYVLAFGVDHFRLPVMFLGWFVLPLIPWLRWSVVRDRWRSLITLFIASVAFTMFVLGPSNVWLFRWPLRMVVYLWFPILLLWVIVASEGLVRTHWRKRAAISAGIILFGAYLGWSSLPEHTLRIGAGVVVVGALTALVVRKGINTRWGIVGLLAGTFAITGYHIYLYPENNQTEPYHLPTSESYIKQHFSKYHGVTVQIASADILRVQSADYPQYGYKDILFGGQYGVAGVESLTGYGGLGYTAMDNTMCMRFEGSNTCPQPWAELWKVPPGYSVPLADLLRAETIVVHNKLVETRFSPAPAGWRRDESAEESGLFTVWRRIDPLPFPGARVSNASTGVTVNSDAMTGKIDERITYSRTDAAGPGSLTFARLNWPGYKATVNGAKVSVHNGPSGLVVVDLPAGVTTGEVSLTWQPPPGAGPLIAGASAGILLTIGIGLWPVIARRRRDRSGSGPSGDDDDSSPSDVTDPETAPIAVG